MKTGQYDVAAGAIARPHHFRALRRVALPLLLLASSLLPAGARAEIELLDPVAVEPQLPPPARMSPKRSAAKSSVVVLPSRTSPWHTPGFRQPYVAGYAGGYVGSFQPGRVKAYAGPRQYRPLLVSNGAYLPGVGLVVQSNRGSNEQSMIIGDYEFHNYGAAHQRTP